MSEHFRAFSFVDRVDPDYTNSRVQGCYTIPPVLEGFPSSLAAEAVGQLAAWAVMKATGFERRPVAGLAGRIDLSAPATPGKVLQLTADIESLDDEAVAYGGSATIDGVPVIRLEECVGPMIPVTELDDPAALRDRFALLCGAGASPGAFQGLPPLALQRTNGEQGQWAQAEFKVPASAAMFADHFPRRPVFPGSLLVQMSLQLAAMLAGEIPPPADCRWTPQSVLGMKLREFIPPGKRLDIEARLKQRSNDSLTLAIGVRAGEELIGSARLVLVPEGCQ
jgi:3-hydroxyacyl-[acyl-carrier-protein] dehydratase